MSRRKLLPLDQLSNDAQRAFRVTHQQSDIACALVLASFVDQCLGALLKRFLIEGSTTSALLDPTTGPVGPFEARARLAYSLGLIPKRLYQNLDAVAQVRNIFAHSHVDLKFEHAEIDGLCRSLSLPALDIVAPDEQERAKVKGEFLSFISTPRMKYVVNCVIMADRLMKIAASTSRRPLSAVGWEEPAA